VHINHVKPQFCIRWVIFFVYFLLFCLSCDDFSHRFSWIFCLLILPWLHLTNFLCGINNYKKTYFSNLLFLSMIYCHNALYVMKIVNPIFHFIYNNWLLPTSNRWNNIILKFVLIVIGVTCNQLVMIKSNMSLS
jgi:hypothetical protein